MQRIRISTGQFGLGAEAGIDYPLLITTQLMEHIRTNSLHVAWWFVDVRTAFDRIVRQLMIDPGHSLTLNTLLCLGIDAALAKQILRTVCDDRPVLWEQNLSPALVALLSSCFRDTWLTLPEDQGEMQMQTGLGPPQGSSLSGLLFILYQQRIHGLINQHMEERGVALVLPSPEDNSYVMTNAVDTIIPVIAYHDDSLVLIQAQDSVSLVDAIRDIIHFAIPCYEGRNLLLNWSSMKSELLVTLPPTQATSFQATLAKEAEARGWAHPSIMVAGTLIRVVRAYNYLGRKLCDTGSSVQHARARTAIMAASIRQFAPIYQSKSIPLRHKAMLCNGLYSIAQMMHAYATLKETDKTTTKIYGSSYLLSWKACLGRDSTQNGAFLHMTEAEILSRVEKPTWLAWSDAARLRLLLRVARSGCPVFRACMASAEWTTGSWWVAIGNSVNRMQAVVGALQWLPPFTEASRPEWMQYVALNKVQWKKWIKQYLDSDTKRMQEIYRTQSQFVDEVPPPPPVEVTEIYSCSHCERKCSTYRGLLSHRRQAHKVESALATRVATNVCFACHGQFDNRVSHLAHLSNNLQCALATMIHCPRLSEAELKAARQVKQVLRTAPPRRGPKRRIASEVFPVSESVALMDLAIDEP
eukprot:344447-Amphidinium_carterae.1